MKIRMDFYMKLNKYKSFTLLYNFYKKNLHSYFVKCNGNKKKRKIELLDYQTNEQYH